VLQIELTYPFLKGALVSCTNYCVWHWSRPTHFHPQPVDILSDFDGIDLSLGEKFVANHLT
jgi:hypothetical protein